MTTPATITQGATGPTVRWAQYLLVRRTLSCAQIDGSFGPATWTALGGDGPQPPTLTSGSTGAVVEKLQTVLNEGRGDFAPASNPALVIAGDCGPQTALAVRGIQSQAGLAPDGIVGLKTWAIPVHAAGETVADLCGVPAPGVG